MVGEAMDILVSRYASSSKRETIVSKIIYRMNNEQVNEIRAFVGESMNTNEEE